MHPARSLGPALVAGRLESLWIYLAAPLVGALLACVMHRPLNGPRRPSAARPPAADAPHTTPPDPDRPAAGC